MDHIRQVAQRAYLLRCPGIKHDLQGCGYRSITGHAFLCGRGRGH